MNCFKYLHENGSSTICINTATCANLDCLKYALEHGCPWDPKTVQEAKRMNKNGTHNDYFKYLQEHGLLE